MIAAIQHLDAHVLIKVIHHVGLEDSGEIVSLATTDQIKKLFDEDLWRNDRPGQDEKFDAERFGLWLQILLEPGTDFAIQKIVEMDEDFLTLAFAHQVWVIDIHEIELSLSNRRSKGFNEDDLLEKAMESSLSHEFENYLIISKHPETWDAVLSCLITLDSNNHDFFIRMMSRCCYLSSEQIEENGGLYHVLTSSEQLESDVAASREERREKEGFVPPATASSFLKLARQSLEQEDFVTPSYFKNYEMAPSLEKKTTKPSKHLARFLETLKESPILTPHQELFLLGNSSENHPFGKIQSALTLLQSLDQTIFAQRMKELTYLANTLVSGCNFKGRRFRPADAVAAVLATCEIGLELSLNQSKTEIQILSDQTMTHIFRVGWNTLYREVLVSSAIQLNDHLRELAKTREQLNSWDRDQIKSISKVLEKSIQGGTPWTCLDQLDLLEIILDQDKVKFLKDLLDECPTFHGQFFANKNQIRTASKELAEIFQRMR